MHRIAAFALALSFSLSAHAATFTVNDTGDAGDATPGNGTCATAGSVCTLRAALQEANTNVAADTIEFSIGSGPQTITPATPLPISSNVIIDGTTQPGSGPGPRILIDGQNTTAVGFLSTIGGVGVTIQGFAIGGFPEAGIRAMTMTGVNLTVKRCHLGVGLDGMTAMPNGDGIEARVPSTSGGSLILGDASGGGNVLSGNLDMAVEVAEPVGGTGAGLVAFTVQGNKIGLGSDGMTAVPNAGGGIRLNFPITTITIGGSVAGRNLISGNNGGGFITLNNLQSTSIDFSHNYVGVAQDGITARGNNGSGARLVSRTYSVSSNVFASNQGNGLFLDTALQPSTVRGNRIGVAIDDSARGNTLAGIRVGLQNGGSITIGGPASDQNVIANNGGAGVVVTDDPVDIAENSIYDNNGLGIDLDNDGVTPNDVLDADTGGGNNRQNFPVINSAVRAGGVTFISGTLGSAASSAYTVRFFSNSSADPAEGQTYIGSIPVTTNLSGNVSFNFSTPFAAEGTFITATATDSGLRTSEFSAPLIVSAPPQFRFTAPSYPTIESGNVVATVERINGSSGTATVNWATEFGSATGGDFTADSGTLTFLNGETSQPISIAITPDSIDEGLESFGISLSSPSGGVELGSPSSTIVHITDDDPSPAISVADASNAENVTPRAFNVTLSAPSELTITVDYLTSNGTATAGADYAATAGTLTFAPNETSKTINVPIVDDPTVELDETFNVTLSNPTLVTIGDGAAVGTIQNDDGMPSITIDDVASVEGDSATFTVTLSGPSASTVTVGWSTSDGSASSSGDYQSGSGTLSFAPGELTQPIVVTIDEDSIVETSETFFVDLAGPANATLADAQGGGTIADDDGTPSLSINDPAVVEGVNATFTVTLAPASATAVTVNWGTSDGTAANGSDYTGGANTLTFAPGQPSQTIDIATTPDGVAESAEQFTITLSSPNGAIVADDTGTGTIIDDDGVPRVTIGNDSLSESNGTLSFTVDLSHASASTITVDWTTADDTATGPDYTAASGTLTFVPGDTSESIDVTIAEDVLIEADERFLVQLTGATNATITDDEGAGTITNDDGAVQVSISSAGANEGTGGATTFSFDVTLNGASAAGVSVQWATADGTANAGTDYTAGAGSVDFAPGETSKTIPISIATDSTFEANETFFVNLIAATNATIVNAQGTGTIVNDDPAPAVPSISIAPASATEGNSGTAPLVFAVTLNVPTINTVTVVYATGGGAALADSDYVGATGTLTFAPGVTSQNITIAAVGDTLVEGNETFLVTLSAPVNATIGTASATGTIVDDDTAPAIPAISIANGSAVEGNAGSTPLSFVVTLDVPTVNTVTVNYATSNGSALEPADYAGTSGTLSFAPGVTSQSVVVPVIGDTFVEGNETFTVTLSAPDNGTLGAASATGTILDDDTAPAVPSISIANTSVIEGNAGSAPLTFAVTFDGPTVNTVTVNYATSPGTATAASDYATTSGTLTFAPGTTTQNIVVPAIGDTVVEGNETLTVTLSSPVNATLGTASATGTIVDDDTLPVVPAISIGDLTRFEGNAGATLLAFPVTLNVGGSAPVSIAWTTVNGSATSSDFVGASGTVVFAPGMTAQTIFVAVNGDEDVEPDETFSVQLSGPANATLADAVANGTIRNDDEPSPATPSLRAAAASVVEGHDGTTEVRVTLTLSSRASGGASVRWLTRSGTATGGADYAEASGRTTFGSGTTTATLAIAVIGDRVDEDDETFVVELFDADGASLRDERVTITIVDDDVPVAPRAIVLAVGSLRGNAGSRFGTEVQMVNLSDGPAEGALVIRPAGTSDAGGDVTIPYALGPRELRAFGDLLADHGLAGLATLDIVPALGPLPRMTVRIYDDGSGHGTTGFTLPVVTPADALVAGDTGLLVAPADPASMRFNIGVRSLDDGSSMTIEVRDRTGATRHTTTREVGANWFNQLAAADFAGVALEAGDYLAIHITRGSAILYGASVDNVTNDPSVQLATR